MQHPKLIPTCYTAGGMRTPWRQQVSEAIPEGMLWLDPCVNSPVKLNVNQYATWDLYQVKQADIVFAYMERTNPAGHGMAVEMGYAKGLGKTIILVRELGHPTIEDRYLEFMDKVADVVFHELSEGIEYLKLFKAR